jgi:sec-independent protein translocase protein TatC
VATLLLGAGMTLAYWFLPRALEVLVNDLGGDRFEAFFTADQYLSFLTKMILAFGIAFQLPVVLVFLQLVGLVQPETLKSNRRVAVIFVVVLAAIITPTGDPFTLGVLAVPMYLFYELSILIGSRRKKQDPYADPAS